VPLGPPVSGTSCLFSTLPHTKSPIITITNSDLPVGTRSDLSAPLIVKSYAGWNPALEPSLYAVISSHRTTGWWKETLQQSHNQLLWRQTFSNQSPYSPPPCPIWAQHPKQDPVKSFCLYHFPDPDTQSPEEY
jgi:hypothetical protein